MNTLPNNGAGEESGMRGGDFPDGAAFDAAHVYRTLHDACIALERAEEHAAAAYVEQAMSMVQKRYSVGDER